MTLSRKYMFRTTSDYEIAKRLEILQITKLTHNHVLRSTHNNDLTHNCMFIAANNCGLAARPCD